MFAVFSLFQTSALKCKDFKYCFPFSYTTHTISFSVSYKQIYIYVSWLLEYRECS